MKITFDYEGTIDQEHILKYAKELSQEYDVSILTRRDMDKEVKSFGKAHSMKVNFTYGRPKFQFMRGVDYHIDNDINEVNEINMETSTVAIHIDCLKDLEYLLSNDFVL